MLMQWLWALSDEELAKTEEFKTISNGEPRPTPCQRHLQLFVKGKTCLDPFPDRVQIMAVTLHHATRPRDAYRGKGNPGLRQCLLHLKCHFRVKVCTLSLLTNTFRA